MAFKSQQKPKDRAEDFILQTDLSSWNFERVCNISP